MKMESLPHLRLDDTEITRDVTEDAWRRPSRAGAARAEPPAARSEPAAACAKPPTACAKPPAAATGDGPEQGKGVRVRLRFERFLRLPLGHVRVQLRMEGTRLRHKGGPRLHAERGRAVQHSDALGRMGTRV